jgi:hypothetical protein
VIKSHPVMLSRQESMFHISMLTQYRQGWTCKTFSWARPSSAFGSSGARPARLTRPPFGPSDFAAASRREGTQRGSIHLTESPPSIGAPPRCASQALAVRLLTVRLGLSPNAHIQF